ncbi:tape measure protein [Endozoicomonas gorgoniicola]|uniref:Tape measure protein n=1 Tax=Endozoicomonas gorgoniicola TaxID=1234144 RepID=A0ABT3MQY9_9GAMM|nr:tape measure protein [Endozoicomonas gorgoniicola]MCW7551775.1 tape measure protein [Endozoicomonas gorgoniicola]
MGSVKESALRLVLKARDTLSGPLQQSAKSLEKLRHKTHELKQQLSTLEQQDKLLSAFQQQKKTVQASGQAYKQAEQKVEQLAQEYKKTAKPTKAMQRSLDNARKSVIAANRAYQQQRGKLAELRGSLEKAGLSNRKIAQQQNRLQRELKQTSAAYQKLTAKSQQANRTLRRNPFKKVASDASLASKGINGLAGRFTALVSAGAGLYAIKRAMQGVLGAGDQFERLEVQLAAIMGSIEEGNRAVEWIKDFTSKTPLELQQVADSFTALKNFGLDPMDGTLQAIVDQTSKLGGGMERLNGMTLALGQAWAKQKLQGEEILQLVERGVPVWSLLEKVTGKNTQELQKLSSAGKLGRDTIKLLIEEIGKSSEGAAAANMSLLSGLMANMSDEWLKFKGQIADSGWLDYVKGQLKSFAISIQELTDNGKLAAVAQSISDGFISMAESIKASLSGVTIEGFVSGIKNGFRTVSTALSDARSAFEITGSTVKLFFNGFMVGVNGFGAVVTATFASITSGLSSLFKAVNADEMAAKTAAITATLDAMSNDFAAKVKQDASDVNAALSDIGDSLVRNNELSQQKIRQHNKKTIDQLLDNYQQVKPAAEEVAKAAQSAFADAADALKQIDAAETRTELADLGVALAEAYSNGTLTQEQYTEALERVKQKLQEVTQVAQSLGKEIGGLNTEITHNNDKLKTTGSGLAGVFNRTTAELHALSAQAEDAFLAMQGATQIDTSDTSDQLGQLKHQLREAKEEAGRLANVTSGFDPTGIGSWLSDTAANAAYVKAQFLQQKVTLESLLSGYEDGTLTAQNLAYAGRSAAHSLDLLNHQDLDRLTDAIDQAEDSMEQLGNSTRSTLDSMQDELDQLQGKQESIERRRFESRNRDLQSQLQEAQQEGSAESVSNIQQALSLNNQIYSERRRQIQQDKLEERQREFKNLPAPPPPKREWRSSEKVIRLEYPGGNVKVGINSSDEAKFLEALKNAGLRSV